MRPKENTHGDSHIFEPKVCSLHQLSLIRESTPGPAGYSGCCDSQDPRSVWALTHFLRPGSRSRLSCAHTPCGHTWSACYTQCTSQESTRHFSKNVIGIMSPGIHRRKLTPESGRLGPSDTTNKCHVPDSSRDLTSSHVSVPSSLSSWCFMAQRRSTTAGKKQNH